MAIARGIAAAAMLTGIAFGTASTAWAEQPTMSGHYIETVTNSAGQSTTNDWYFTPCGDGCASATVNGEQGQARLVNGQWTIDMVGRQVCGDGTEVPNATSAHRTWDPNTLAGTDQQVYMQAACGQPPGYTRTNQIQLRPAA